jgi:ribonuclease P protein component
LRSKDFRRVYDEGTRFSGPLFAAFCLRDLEGGGPHIGFTTPRALGKAVARNRIRRRVREAVRLQLERLNPQWSIVINPRRQALEAPTEQIRREVERLFLRCNGS